MKRPIALIFIILSVLLLAACSGGAKDAKTVFESYMQNIADSDYGAAYELISEFDKENISKELFIKWNTAVAKVQQTESFSISPKTDKFKKYKYMGYEFGDAYGFDVTRKLKTLIPGIELTGYEAENFKILMASGDGEWRVVLLLTQMETNLEKLERALADNENKTK